MNSEEIYSSLRGVSQAIQNFSVRSQEDMTEPPRKREGDGGEEVRVMEGVRAIIFGPLPPPL